MKTTLVLFAAFVTMSLLLWNGCLGNRAGAAARVMAPAAVTIAAGR